MSASLSSSASLQFSVISSCTSMLARRLAHAATRSASSSSSSAVSAVRITTLPNLVRVATESTPAHFASLGVYVDAGSRVENEFTSGVSHFLDRLAFKSTANRSSDQMASAVDAFGGQIICASSREAMMYQASLLPSDSSIALSIMADTIINPLFSDEELHSVRESTRYEIRELQSKPDLILPEILHTVAYGGVGLGNDLICPEERVDMIDKHVLTEFMKEWYQPQRIVIAAAGVPHEELVELAEQHFSRLPASNSFSLLNLHSNNSNSWPGSLTPQLHSSFAATSNPSLPKQVSRAASHYTSSTIGEAVHQPYTGGYRFIQDDESNLNQIYIGFKGLPIEDPDIYTLATLQFILGGGGSFSAGGPGKGMYSRLYTHVLNHHPEIDHCAAFHHIYTDSSLFGLFGNFFSTSNGNGHTQGVSPRRVLPHLIHQLSLLLHSPINAVELARAKNQLKSSLVMAVESRSVEVEDLGRQILVHGRKIPVMEMCDRIDEITSADVSRVAHRIFGSGCTSSPTVIVSGTDGLPDWGRVFRQYGVVSSLEL